MIMSSTILRQSIEYRSNNILSAILDPLGSPNLPQLYAANSFIIDFIIYLILFIGLSRATLAKRFPGAPGRLISLGIGLILAVSLSVTQYRMQFSIVSFGPFAALILLSVAGIMFFQILFSFEFSVRVSASVSYLAIYSSIRAFVPSVFDWMVIHLPFLAGILSVVFIISVFSLFASIIPRTRRDNENSSLFRYLPELIPKLKDSFDLSDRANQMTNDIEIAENDVFKNLKKIKQYLPQLMDSERGRLQLRQIVRTLNFREYEINETLKKLQELDCAILRQDIEGYQKILGMTKKIPQQDLPKALKSLTALRDRLDLEKVIIECQKKIEGIYQIFEECMQILSQAVERGDTRMAQKALEDAIRLEKAMKETTEMMKKLEDKLKSQFERSINAYGKPSRQGRNVKLKKKT